MPKILPDFTGQKFGKLSVETCLGILSRPTNRSKTDKWYKCLCDCGNYKDVQASGLNTGNIKSCGCLQKEGNLKALKQAWKVRTDTSNHSMIMELIDTYSRLAAKRGLSWNLDKETCEKLFTGNCYYCDSPPNQIVRKRKTAKTHKYNGIDRKNNIKGYEKDNTVSCCKWCNWMKRELSEEEFLEKIKKIYNKSCK